ncbi:putative threonylcarbamoyladenosine tRNA methylthiotransferase-like [Triplophysa rosa]|uniref:Threonylcarbamoyladenosine tRNA methylthiotransferase-like n=1 Tax=Triplophysa rosa TaxID=992332 RepID=A0A9W7WQ75_TRIRA|nr:putative threonylcarbamoyladenosine tRNA methylthiotransferase-like [Triplophysa rosa]
MPGFCDSVYIHTLNQWLANWGPRDVPAFCDPPYNHTKVIIHTCLMHNELLNHSSGFIMRQSLNVKIGLSPEIQHNSFIQHVHRLTKVVHEGIMSSSDENTFGNPVHIMRLISMCKPLGVESEKQVVGADSLVGSAPTCCASGDLGSIPISCCMQRLYTLTTSEDSGGLESLALILNEQSDITCGILTLRAHTGEQLRHGFNSRKSRRPNNVGERQHVLVTEESFDTQYYVAHNKFYEQVLVPKKSEFKGKMIEVDIYEAGKHYMKGHPAEDAQVFTPSIAKPLQKGQVSGLPQYLFLSVCLLFAICLQPFNQICDILLPITFLFTFSISIIDQHVNISSGFHNSYPSLSSPAKRVKELDPCSFHPNPSEMKGMKVHLHFCM